MSDDWGDTADDWGGIDDEVQPPEPSEPSEPSDPSDPSGPGEREDLSETPEPSDIRLASPIKTEWNEYPTYLYPELHDDVEEVFEDLQYFCKKEADWSPEKYRHFQAVAWTIALEQLEEMEPEEFVALVDELGLRE